MADRSNLFQVNFCVAINSLMFFFFFETATEHTSRCKVILVQENYILGVQK